MSLTAPDNHADRSNQSKDTKEAKNGGHPDPNSDRPSEGNKPVEQRGVPSERKIVAAIEANAGKIQEKVEKDDIERLQNRVNDLAHQIVEVEEENEALRNRLSDLERSHGTAASLINSNLGKLNRLSAAVFGNEPHCPECNEGELKIRNNWWNKTIDCSNDRCGFKQKLAEP